MRRRAGRRPRTFWIYDPERDSLEEIATRERLAVFTTPQLLLKDGRMLVQVIRQDKTPQTFSVNLDGTDAREVTRAGEGLPYGLSLSPDGRRLGLSPGRSIRVPDLARGGTGICRVDGAEGTYVTGGPQQ